MTADILPFRAPPQPTYDAYSSEPATVLVLPVVRVDRDYGTPAPHRRPRRLRAEAMADMAPIFEKHLSDAFKREAAPAAGQFSAPITADTLDAFRRRISTDEKAFAEAMRLLSQGRRIRDVIRDQQYLDELAKSSRLPKVMRDLMVDSEERARRERLFGACPHTLVSDDADPDSRA
jgi:hypothetical protein